MSYLGPQGPGGWRGAEERGREERARSAGALRQRDLLGQDDEGISEVPRKRGMVDRLREVFRRDHPPVIPAVPEVPDGDVWARERQRRRALEQDRPNDA
jgi:hypothetical protein